MKKAFILLFGLIILTGSIFPFNLKVYTSPLDIVAATAIQSAKSFKKIPVYIPGSISLASRLDEYPFEVTKREIYYKIDSAFEDIVGSDAADAAFESAGENEPTEMRLVTFIKHHNIQKKDFEKAVARLKKILESHNMDIYNEEYELPNADIIYTFNNKLINYYYRRA